MRKKGTLQMANTSRIENVSRSSHEQGAGVGGDPLISPPVLPYGPGHHLSPAPSPKDTHHDGTNHRTFDHPPQSCVVIHIPAADR